MLPVVTNRYTIPRFFSRQAVASLGLALGVLSCGEAVVAPAVVREVAVSGGGAPLRLAQSAQLGVTLRGDGGVTLPTAGVTWTSSDQGVATVDSRGQVTAVKRGTATISASAGGVTGTAAVPVIGVQRVDA
ncbi:MAG: Ig-like domain-containing protein, partial [Gemmatimonadaceae bacterium]